MKDKVTWLVNQNIYPPRIAAIPHSPRDLLRAITTAVNMRAHINKNCIKCKESKITCI